MTAQTTAGKQRGRPFGRGVSGNPSGRPTGSRNRATLMAAAVSDNDAVAIARTVVAKAKRGDLVAARLVLDRLWPAPKGRATAIKNLPAVTNAQGVTDAIAAVVSATARGEMAPEEGAAFVSLIEAQRRAIETVEHETRLRAIEERIGTDEQKL